MDTKAASTIHNAESIPSEAQNQFEAYAPAETPNLWKIFKSQVGTKEGWWGEFDWNTMCMPSIFIKDKKHAPFWGLNSKLPLGLALVMGFQHSLAMVKSIVLFYLFVCLFIFYIFDRSVVWLHQSLL